MTHWISHKLLNRRIKQLLRIDTHMPQRCIYTRGLDLLADKMAPMIMKLQVTQAVFHTFANKPINNKQ